MAERDILQINLQKLSPIENFFMGVISGCIEVVCMQPVLYNKNASQQNLPFTFNPKLLYRGVTVSVINMGVLTGLQFPLTDLATKLILRGQKRRLSNHEMILSGLMGGVMSGFICAPMELILIQQQRFGGSMASTFSSVISKHGLTGLFRGLSSTCGREGLWCMGYMGLGPASHRYLKENYHMNNATALMLGSVLTGIAVSTFSHPLDTIKTVMQGDLERTKFKNIIHTSRTLAKEGFQRFFWGWGWRAGRTVFGVLLFNVTKNNLTPLLVPHHFKE